MIVCIDPGHNSPPYCDTGAQWFGLQESDLVLDISKRIQKLILGCGIGVVMTRTGDCVLGADTTVESLKERVRIANDRKVDLFISVHSNAFDSVVKGAETHIFGFGGMAERFAKLVQPELAKIFINRGIKKSNFQVLRDTKMPAVLLEVGFIDNRDDNQKLSDPVIRQLIAVGVAKSVCTFFGVTYREVVPKTVNQEAIDLISRALTLLKE